MPRNLPLTRIQILKNARREKSLGAVYKGRPANGEGGGVVLKFRTFPDGGRGVVCESSDVRKFLRKSKFQNFSELFKVKTRNYNRSRFQYESIHILRLHGSNLGTD